ncbi:MAG: succinate dehydrogenase cytochrome b558 subunit [Phycisphaerae bacterium]
MTATPESNQRLDDRYHFLLRKLHSLSGIVPIGAFLVEHLLTNSMAFRSKWKFNEDVHWIHNLPFLLIVEVLFIFLPLLFHACYGIRIALTAEPNPTTYPYLSNWRYTLQRVSGYIAFVFIIVHLLKYRFAHVIGWGPPFIREGNDYFEITRRGLMEWTPFGYAVPFPVTFAMYYVGLLSAVFHFCNGIWSFCISWGIAVGARAQRRIGFAAGGLAVVLLAWGTLSLYAFRFAAPAASITLPMQVQQSAGPSSERLAQQ